MHAAAAAIIALLDRKVQTDIQGQTIEVAQMETAINMIGHHLVASQFFGEQKKVG
jgi:crotonobetainyl-CoA:carnitine CoA-transferase CaiB-like acyl-CoA transferase